VGGFGGGDAREQDGGASGQLRRAGGGCAGGLLFTGPDLRNAHPRRTGAGRRVARRGGRRDRVEGVGDAGADRGEMGDVVGANGAQRSTPGAARTGEGGVDLRDE